jgi:hypothetical protein
MEYAQQKGYIFHGSMNLHLQEIESFLQEGTDLENFSKTKRVKYTQALTIHSLLFPKEGMAVQSIVKEKTQVWNLIEIPREDADQFLFDHGYIKWLRDDRSFRYDYTLSVLRSKMLLGLPAFKAEPSKDSPERYDIVMEDNKSFSEIASTDLHNYLGNNPGFIVRFSDGVLTCEERIDSHLGLKRTLLEPEAFDRLIEFTHRVTLLLQETKNEEIQ